MCLLNHPRVAHREDFDWDEQSLALQVLMEESVSRSGWLEGRKRSVSIRTTSSHFITMDLLVPPAPIRFLFSLVYWFLFPPVLVAGRRMGGGGGGGGGRQFKRDCFETETILLRDLIQFNSFPHTRIAGRCCLPPPLSLECNIPSSSGPKMEKEYVSISSTDIIIVIIFGSWSLFSLLFLLLLLS